MTISKINVVLGTKSTKSVDICERQHWLFFFFFFFREDLVTLMNLWILSPICYKTIKNQLNNIFAYYWVLLDFYWEIW